MNRPQLFTFDGQARSGKGTIVHAVKRSLQARNIKTMLIDAGQVFRVLVVSAHEHSVDVDSPESIDRFLSDEKMLHETTDLVKKVYHMDHANRDALLYTNEVGANSAKFGARPLAQDFKDNLVRKWLHDASDEGYRVVLMDGRALEEVGAQLESEGLCDFRAGFYFVSDPWIGARRTLGYYDVPYDKLTDEQRGEVDDFANQIIERNRADSERERQPIVPPVGATTYKLPDFDMEITGNERQMAIIDTSADITIQQMTAPIVAMFDKISDL